ncbi:DUF309 domain-containing protein [Neobacillus sp. SM06]|uniref:DUF309 domain-containing protein n=1 Tax=Neobacillus sp. SM06 TaxID=3422492 RepID=UPI003D2D26E0
MFFLYPKEYIEYLVHFHGSRDYFECHEILEDYWKRIDAANKESIWVGFIQLAVSCYHHRRGNFAGAQKTLAKAKRIFSQQEQNLLNLGMDPDEMAAILEQLRDRIDHHNPYKSFRLPVWDPILMDECQRAADLHGFDMKQTSDVTDEKIVHRHRLRDRTWVIRARKEALKKKRGSE